MYERSYGYRYDETGNASIADIAKMIRRDVKQAKEEGLLPVRWSYSVRSSHGTSIDVEVRDCPDAWRPCDGMSCHNVWCAARNDPQYAHAATPHDVLTDEAAAAKMTLERIHNAYNHDGSELQSDYFDVRYYGHVEFEDAGSADFRKRQTELLAERKSARATGEIVSKVTNYKRDGSHVTHVVIKTATSHVLGCGSRSWRGAMVCKADDDAVVTCSRCAKRAAGSVA